MYSSTLCLTSTLDGGGLSTSRHAKPIYPQERPGTHCIGGSVGSRAVLDRCGKSRPTGIRFPYRPSPSRSLYRLRYPDPRAYDIQSYFSHSLPDGLFMPLKQDNFKIDNFEQEIAATNAIFTFNCVTMNLVAAVDSTLLKTTLTAHLRP